MHNILYTVINSNAMNGWDENTRIVEVIPWWQTALIALDVVLALGTVLCAVQLVKAVKVKKAMKTNG